jgi:hypothetical protein
MIIIVKLMFFPSSTVEKHDSHFYMSFLSVYYITIITHMKNNES